MFHTQLNMVQHIRLDWLYHKKRSLYLLRLIPGPLLQPLVGNYDQFHFIICSFYSSTHFNSKERKRKKESKIHWEMKRDPNNTLHTNTHTHTVYSPFWEPWWAWRFQLPSAIRLDCEFHAYTKTSPPTPLSLYQCPVHTCSPFCIFPLHLFMED